MMQELPKFRVGDIPPEPPRRPELKVDDRVLVRNKESDGWQKRHFKHWSGDGRVACFDNGATSWASEGYGQTWNFYRLPEEGE